MIALFLNRNNDRRRKEIRSGQDGDDNYPGVHEQGHRQLYHQQRCGDDEDVPWSSSRGLLNYDLDRLSFLIHFKAKREGFGNGRESNVKADHVTDSWDGQQSDDGKQWLYVRFVTQETFQFRVSDQRSWTEKDTPDKGHSHVAAKQSEFNLC